MVLSIIWYILFLNVVFSVQRMKVSGQLQRLGRIRLNIIYIRHIEFRWKTVVSIHELSDLSQVGEDERHIK